MNTRQLPASRLTHGTWVHYNGTDYQITEIETEFAGEFNGSFQEFDYMFYLRGGPRIGAAYNALFTVTKW
ncbi:hypothetical protein M8C13_40365 [Crossiella sp. SN42]|uniref:hypothetical protein n=1 Tax=Crossiella sp. SN42 TaxID=2944808 RepID=UPI00207CA15D|nr:hypothetical protein [Crossiella sp. SN42]MCO1582022.1 hypothetical protein [Crossiella sp. SN42]